MEKETPMQEDAPDHLSDLLAQLAEVEKRGINVLNSREDLMDETTFDNTPTSPPPELYSSQGIIS
jgi:hypothetical protein